MIAKKELMSISVDGMNEDDTMRQTSINSGKSKDISGKIKKKKRKIKY
jgi:hypothetical protein